MSDLKAYGEHPYRWEIARIKKAGEVAALKEEIEQIKHRLTHTAWENTERNGRYAGLSVAIARAELDLQNMRLLLASIREIDTKHN